MGSEKYTPPCGSIHRSFGWLNRLPWYSIGDDGQPCPAGRWDDPAAAAFAGQQVAGLVEGQAVGVAGILAQ